MIPSLDAAHAEELRASELLVRSEQALGEWQHTWDEHSQSVARSQRETQVERARIEELENQQRRLLQQQERQEAERLVLVQVQPAVPLEALESQAAASRDAGQKAAAGLQELLAELSVTRERERGQTEALNALRAKWQEALGTQVSTEALQQAALGKVSGKVTQWLKAQSLDHQPRVAQQLRVDRGWERAVETVLGSYLEAVCVDGLDDVADVLGSFDGGQLAMVTINRRRGLVDAHQAQAKWQERRAARCCRRHSTRRWQRRTAAASTAGSPWSHPRQSGLGPDWLRLSWDQDPHSGVIEREESLRDIQCAFGWLAKSRVQHPGKERRLWRGSPRISNRRQRLPHRSIDRRAALDAAQARTADAARRLGALETGLADVRADLTRTESDLRASRARMGLAIEALAALEPERLALEQERERLRGEQADARTAAQAVQTAARELAVQVESRRAAHATTTTTLARVEKQLEGLALRRDELAAQLAEGEAPLAALQEQIESALQIRVQIEGELHAARVASDELDAVLRDRETQRSGIEERVEAARTAMDDTRLAAQQVRVRRETVAEQLSTTGFELAELIAQLAPEASVATWDSQLEETKSKIERLGQVNVAAIGEFKD
jgi:chromosome segregation protein